MSTTGDMGNRGKRAYWARAVRTLRLKRRRDGSKLNLGSFTLLGSDRALDEAVDARLRFVSDFYRQIGEEFHAERAKLEAERERAMTAVAAQEQGFLQSPEDHAAEQRKHVTAISERSYAADQKLLERYNQNRGAAWEAAFYPFREYVRQVGNVDALRSKLRTGSGAGSDQSQQLVGHQLEARYNSMRHTPDRAGYRHYLQDVQPSFYKNVLSQKVRAYVDADAHRRHTYVVGTTGSGKTELLKGYVYALMQGGDASVVVLDPAGDMAQQIAKWPEHRESGRLIYLDLGLREGHVPTINPFDADGVRDGDKIVLAQQIMSAFEEILRGDLGGALSVNMRAILLPSIRLLLDLPGATLRDLEGLMSDDPELIAAGQGSRFPEIARFFTRDFVDRSRLGVTKNSIANKLASILNTGVLERLTCGRSTIDLGRRFPRSGSSSATWRKGGWERKRREHSASSSSRSSRAPPCDVNACSSASGR